MDSSVLPIAACGIRSYFKTRMGNTVDFAPLSRLYRFTVYSISRPKTRLRNGMLIISIDVDVGSKELGLINKGKNDANVSRDCSEYSIGEIEETALPLFNDVLNHFEIPVTLALRGQLTEVDSGISGLFGCSTKHDIGAHGYYHREFSSLSFAEARRELEMISVGMKKIGITPKSFVFPRNKVAHLNLLEQNGYKCFRGDRLCMHIAKEGGLYNIYPSLFLRQDVHPRLVMRLIDVSISKRLPFHIWFHLWNFGRTRESMKRSIERLFFPVFKYSQQKVRSGVLTFETMLSAAEKMDKLPE